MSCLNAVAKETGLLDIKRLRLVSIRGVLGYSHSGNDIFVPGKWVYSLCEIPVLPANNSQSLETSLLNLIMHSNYYHLIDLKCHPFLSSKGSTRQEGS